MTSSACERQLSRHTTTDGRTPLFGFLTMETRTPDLEAPGPARNAGTAARG